MSINKVNIKSITPPENICSNAVLQYSNANAQFQWRYDSSEYANNVTDYLIGVSPYMIRNSASIDTVIVVTNDGANLSYDDTLGQVIFSDYYYAIQGSVSGYTSGGSTISAPITYSNIIDKFPFSTDTNATDVGDLTQSRSISAGQSSIVSGYTSGGSTPSRSDIIDKFPFAADSNATDVGDLSVVRTGSAGQSSSESGYISGGVDGPGILNIIDKFPFAADGNAADVGDLTQNRSLTAGQNSLQNGYTSGGNPPGFSDVIDKFSFSTDANATDV